jgi:hypothetical protein
MLQSTDDAMDLRGLFFYAAIVHAVQYVGV